MQRRLIPRARIPAIATSQGAPSKLLARDWVPGLIPEGRTVPLIAAVVGSRCCRPRAENVVSVPGSALVEFVRENLPRLGTSKVRREVPGMSQVLRLKFALLRL